MRREGQTAAFIAFLLKLMREPGINILTSHNVERVEAVSALVLLFI